MRGDELEIVLRSGERVVYYTTGCKPRELQYVPVPKRQSAAALPRNLKRLREAKEWTVASLAVKSTVSESTIRGIEDGDGKHAVHDPMLSTCLKLAKALNCGIEELVEERP